MKKDVEEKSRVWGSTVKPKLEKQIEELVRGRRRGLLCTMSSPDIFRLVSSDLPLFISYIYLTQQHTSLM